MTMSRSTVGLAVLAATLCACAKEPPVVQVKGECSDVFHGQVCTWARVKGTTVVEVGADVSLASIDGAPKEDQMAWPPVPVARLALPKEAQVQSGLTELTMYWEAMGHPPAPYLTPHFDFHFYTVPPEQQAAIDCADASKPPALPAAYSMMDLPLPPPMAKMTGVDTLFGLCVPRMGMHSMLTTELESKDLFRGSMIIGYYHAKPIFVEPMLSRAMLLEKHSFDLPVPSIPGMTGSYPRTFHASYEELPQVYHFVFSTFASGA
jgi:hypothetical protein